MRFHRYDGLAIGEVVEALLDRLPASDRPGASVHEHASGSRRAIRPSRASSGSAGSSLRVADIIATLKRLDPSRYSFTADVGDSWFIGLELRTEVFLAAGYYASMGFAVPGALGAGIAEPGTPAFCDRGRRRLPDDGNRAGDHGRSGPEADRAACSTTSATGCSRRSIEQAATMSAEAGTTRPWPAPWVRRRFGSRPLRELRDAMRTGRGGAWRMADRGRDRPG